MEQGNGLVYCVQILPRLRPVPDRPPQPGPAPGAEGRAPSGGRQGWHPRTPRESPSHGDTQSGSRAAVEQRRCSAQPGVSTKRCQGGEQRREGLCKMGRHGAQMAPGHSARRAPAAGALLLVGTRLLPPPSHALSVCLLFVAVFLSLLGEPKRWLLGFRPRVADVVGRLAGPFPGQGRILESAWPGGRWASGPWDLWGTWAWVLP